MICLQIYIIIFLTKEMCGLMGLMINQIVFCIIQPFNSRNCSIPEPPVA